MKIDLKNYLNERDSVNQSSAIDAGPVVTFSREYGCEANRIVRMLILQINKLQNVVLKHRQWSIVNKEILEESAHDLNLKADDLEQRVLNYSSDAMNGLFKSFTQHYAVSDKMILEKVRDIIQNYARKGNVIIVGRGGAALTQEIRKAIHVRLYAPLEWRAKAVAEKRGISIKEAIDICKHFDEKRSQWTEHLVGSKMNETIFHIKINMAMWGDKEVVRFIMDMMYQKHLIYPDLIHQQNAVSV